MTATSAMSYRAILLIITLSFAIAIQAEQLPKEKAHINGHPVVETKKKDNVYFVYAEMDVSFTPAEFLTLVNASDSDCSWIANCRQVKILSKKKNVQIIHTELDVQWPFKDRDMVVLTVSDLKEESLSIQLSDQSTFAESSKKYVRITDITGEWKMVKKDKDTYSLSYKGAASPNGVIPDWFAVNYLADSTEKTFVALNDRLKKD